MQPTTDSGRALWARLATVDGTSYYIGDPKDMGVLIARAEAEAVAAALSEREVGREAVMETIWVVTSGIYSDYGFVCAFKTQALAEAYAERSNRADFEVRKDWDWIFDKDPRTFEVYMAHHGNDYGQRAEPCQLWDVLPAVEEVE